MNATTNNIDYLGRCPEARKSVMLAINAALAGDGECSYQLDDGIWAIHWSNCPLDPFTDEPPQSEYHTAGACLDAAIASHQ